MRKWNFIVLGVLLLAACNPIRQKAHVLASPDGKIMLELQVPPDSGAISYTVSHGGTLLLDPSTLGIQLSGEKLDFSGSLRLKSRSDRSIDESYVMPSGKQKERRNQCEEAVFEFENESGRAISVVFRVFNDGVAFRYMVDNPERSGVELEQSGYRFREISNIWSIPFSSGDERIFKKYASSVELAEQALSFPVLVESGNGHWFLATEADVSDYPLSSGMFDGEHLAYVFAREKEAVNEVPAGFVSPWRVLMLGENLAAIVENCMVDHLAPPAPEAIPDWVEAGVTSFPWWGENLANSHPEILKKYIDLSAEMGWRYMEFDVALVNAPAHAVEDWKTTPWIGDIVEYGKEMGVLCYGWDEYKNLNTPEKRADIFGRYVDLGIVGCKVDFINSYSQHTRKVVEEIIQDAAKYKLMLSFHGAQSPRGFARTYPHVLTFEAVKGAEYYLNITGGKGLPPSHNCILPFTRNVLGSMDYTPVAFTSEIRTTTMAHELALAVIFESGWQGMCDVPEAYLESPGKAYLQDLPAAWDETRFLSGYPGEYCCLARRSGETWYVAGISAGENRKISLDLSSILQENATVVFYGDDPGEVDVIRVAEKELDPSIPLEIAFKRNGGFAFAIRP